MGITVRDLKHQHQINVLFGRLRRNGNDTLCNWDTTFEQGDLVGVIGEEEEVARSQRF
ncbi:MAG: hypothetical protein IPJ74_13265 [Saprospiraceae bacterium]|nr:hypothetical protein [Saprospiraceae bacterium]